MSSSSTPSTKRTKFYLFGYPISHSASPALHNHVFAELGLPHRYHLHETKTVDDPDSQMLQLIQSSSFGGAAVTMPLKVSVMPYVDVLSPEVKEIGSLNTIVVQNLSQDGTSVLLGKNTDWEGIRDSLLSFKGKGVERGTLPDLKGRWAFIIGGGGTTRAAVYALGQMGLSKIFLINRNPPETQEIIKQFPQYDLVALTSLDQWTPECEEKVACGVGAIPSFEPVTDAERNVYALARRVFSSQNRLNERRRFLEMCYKPRKTLLYNIAIESGWAAIGGVDALLHQGLAQDRIWLLQSAASPWAGKRLELGPKIEDSARAMISAHL